MEANEIIVIKNSIDTIGSVDLSFLITEKDGTNIIQRLTASELTEIIKRSMVIFNEAIEDNLLYSFSRYFIRREDQNVADIVATIQNLTASLQNKNSSEIESWALQVQNFVYEKGLVILLVRKEKPGSLEEIKQLRNENKILNKALRESLSETKVLTRQVDELKTSLETFKDQKEKELTQITNNLTSTNQTKEQIEQTQIQTSQIKSNLDKAFAEASASFSSHKENIEKLSIDYSDIAKSIKERKNDTEKIIQDNNEAQTELGNLKNEANRIYKELEKLLNPAIAKDLQRTFRERKIWLFASTIVWLVIAAIISIILACYVTSLFTNKEFSFEIEKVIVSALRLTPVVIILYFAIKQFNIARSLEEEYAFRESVATSLMAYAEQIKTDPNRKEELIKETVNRLYESPTRGKQTKSSWFSKENKNVKDLLELVKEIKELTKDE